jgi:mono/diheme cytochrome c family protein
MKARRPVIATLVLSLAAALATTAMTSAQSPSKEKPDPMLTARGAAEWANACGHCHNLRDPREFSVKSWALIMGHMRVRANIPGQEARDIAAFLEASRTQVTGQGMQGTGGPASPGETVPTAAPGPAAAMGGGIEAVCGFSGGNPTHGATIYAQTCVACHGPDGRGRIPGTPDFTKNGGALSRPHTLLQTHIQQGFSSPNSPMSMPPRGGNAALTDQDIRDVHAYLHKRFGCG